ncbi:MAG TPA: Hsp20/alpha crystallin family protein [Armatimonadota bacterium]|nr:Hsp20/alpha crystallin family protein [Armatimonadota bacterium]
MFKDYEDLARQMEFEMQRCSAEAMRRLLELPGNAQEFWLPRADVYETVDELVVRVEVAGVQRESLSVSLSADRRVLSIRGTRTERHVDDRKKILYYQLEVYFGSFERDILLPRDIPVDADRISATYREGFLVVTLPKLDQAQITRTIPISDYEEEASE